MTPPRILISVLLPAPFSPTSACTSANSAVRLPAVRARTPPNERVISVASIAGFDLVTLRIWSGRSGRAVRLGGQILTAQAQEGLRGDGRSAVLGTACP